MEDALSGLLTLTLTALFAAIAIFVVLIGPWPFELLSIAVEFSPSSRYRLFANDVTTP